MHYAGTGRNHAPGRGEIPRLRPAGGAPPAAGAALRDPGMPGTGGRWHDPGMWRAVLALVAGLQLTGLAAAAQAAPAPRPVTRFKMFGGGVAPTADSYGAVVAKAWRHAGGAAASGRPAGPARAWPGGGSPAWRASRTVKPGSAGR